MTIVWLLDVDGVINARRPGWGAAPRTGLAYADGMCYRIRWAPELVSRIRAISDHGVNVRWCTTWVNEISQIENLVKLPQFGRTFMLPDDRTSIPHAKLATALDVVRHGHRLIWTDDDAIPSDGPAHDELVRDGRALLLSPSASRGLQPDHISLIEDFIHLEKR